MVCQLDMTETMQPEVFRRQNLLMVFPEGPLFCLGQHREVGEYNMKKRLDRRVNMGLPTIFVALLCGRKATGD